MTPAGNIAAVAADILCVVPARGGSTRVPRKNIRSLGGRPLLRYTIDAVAATGLDLALVVSTEDREIAAAAEAAGAEVLMRPEEYSTSTASTEVVLLHALDESGRRGRSYRWVMTLPPTSPFRRGDTIRRFVELLAQQPDSQDCLMSVNENYGDFWVGSDGEKISRLFPDAPRRQQDREPLLEENSAIYITSVAALRGTGSVLGESVRGVVIDPVEALDINVPLDFAIAEAVLREQGELHGLQDSQPV